MTADGVPPCDHCGQPIAITDGVIYLRTGCDTIRGWHTDRPDCWQAARTAERQR